MSFNLRRITFLFLGLIILLIIIPSLPAQKYNTEITKTYFNLVNKADNIGCGDLDGALNYINKQYDVSDFFISTFYIV
jgi:hypothetical protein